MKKLFIGGLSFVTVGFIILLASLAAGFDQPVPTSTASVNTNTTSHDGHHAPQAEQVSYKPGAQPFSANIVEIDIQGFTFSSQIITVPVGTTVRWTNRDAVSHPVVALNGAFQSPAPFPQNAVYEFTFTQPGTYDYKCGVHQSMTGKIVVEPVIIDVEIKNFSYAPATITIPVGAAVRWTNKDAFQHTVTSSLFDSGTLTQNQSFIFTFTNSGHYIYLCSFHDMMLGTIIVQAPSAQLTALNPNTTSVGSGDFVLQVSGSGFITTTGSVRPVVTWNGADLDSQVVSSELITATVPAALLASPQIAQVSVRHRAYTSSPNSLPFTVTTTPCPPGTALNVTKTTDDDTCGTLGRAVYEAALASSPVTISFSIAPGSIIRLTSPLTIPSGTTVDAPCQMEGAVFFLDGNGQPSLVLENDVKLYGLIIYGFEGPQIIARNGSGSVKLFCTRIRGDL